MKNIIVFAFIITAFSGSLFAQDTFKIDKFSFTIGESFENFFVRHPEFQYFEYIDDNYPEDVIQNFYSFPGRDVYISVRFFKYNLYYICVEDRFDSGFLTDFNPVDYGFTKTGEESEFVDNMYNNVITEKYQKQPDLFLKICYGRFSFLSIEKKL